MSDLQAIDDRVQIQAPRGEYSDAAMMRHYDRLASPFAHVARSQGLGHAPDGT